MSKRRTRKKEASNIPIAVLVVIAFALGFVAGFVAKGIEKEEYFEVKVESIKETPQLNINLQKHIKIKKEPKKKPLDKRASSKSPQIAIVIDDFGYEMYHFNMFKKLKYPIAFSIIPFSEFDRKIAKLAPRYGKIVMLHIPMEANTKGEKIEKLEKATDGILLTNMSDKQIKRLLEEQINRIPEAVAANNHMGSKFTRNLHKMITVIGILKKHGIFFLDSKTDSRSVCKQAGDIEGWKVLERDIFLDNTKDVAYIKKQLEELANIATKKGFAIAIGHPHKSTYLALKEKLPELEDRGIKVVSIKEIFKNFGGNSK